MSLNGYIGIRSFALALLLCATAAAQIPSNVPQPATSAPQAPSTHMGAPGISGPGVALYQKLSSAGLDAKAIYSVRDANLDREDLHITLEDGTIGFLESVDGRVTGAFFQGTGEILVFPPNLAERGSMSLFTGTAIMEEKFTSAYLRFNDDTFAQLKPRLQAIEDTQPFLNKWSSAAKTLAESDTLRLMASYMNAPPPSGDRFLRARMESQKLGIFDAYYDTLSAEQIAMFRFSYGDGGNGYYDVLASFPMRSARRDEKSGEAERSMVETLTLLNRLRIRSYKVDSTVAPPQTLSSKATLDIEVRNPGDRLLFFELSRNLKVSAVEMDGKPLEFLQNIAIEGSALARRGNDVIAVIVPNTLQTGQQFHLAFTYSGDVLSDAGNGLVYVGARGVWYPNRGLAMGDYDLTFRYPSDWILVATGKKTVQTESAGTTTAHYVSERPYPVAGFQLGKYATAKATSGNIKVEAYATSGVEHGFLGKKPPLVPPAAVPGAVTSGPDPTRNAQSVADQAAHAIDYFARAFGPYPYSSLALAQMPGDYGQAWPSLVFLPTLAYLSREELARERVIPSAALLFNEFMTPHETAHQWWGDLVGWKSYRDQWLVEALASYSAMLELEKDHSDDCRTFLDHYRQSLLQKNDRGEENAQAGPVTLGQRLNSSHFPIGFVIVSYGRGMWLMHMLRTMLDDGAALSNRPNDEPFLRVLRNMRERYEGKEISTREFQKLLEEELPPSLKYEDRASLDWFFDNWVNGSAIPRIEIKDVRIGKRGAGLSATATITQKEAPDDLITSVPVYAETAAGQKLVARVFADGAETKIRVAVPAGTKRLVIDPYQTILSRP